MQLARFTCAVAFAALAACASDLAVYRADGARAPGVPAHAPVVVEVTTTNHYQVDARHPEQAHYCVDDETVALQVLPLGELYYVDVEPAPLGGAEFSVSFAESGLLRGVTLNSDPEVAETIEAAGRLLEGAAPIAEVALAPAAPAAATDAQRMKARYCLRAGQEVRIERAKLP
jgi:hypothetical protein